MNVKNVDDKDLPRNENEERKVPHADERVPLADERVFRGETGQSTAGQSTLRRSPRLHLGVGAQRH